MVCGNPVRAETEPPQLTILVLGDSLSAAYQMSPEMGWVSLLEQKLAAQVPTWRVVNGSRSGDTTLDGLIRFNALLDIEQPDIVILELGANDGLRGYPVSSIRANLVELIDRAQDAGAYVVLAGMQLPQNYGPKYLSEFKSMYEDLADEKETALIPFLMDGVATESELMQEDGIHPNEDGQPGLLANVWPVLEPQLYVVSASRRPPEE